ncbi:ribonuclease Y [Candidatus Ruminimicrobiellum ovillum]|uniref:ribonuclease Y n=3 Tax=Candidatus Ruminimicrobiellum ovillum TaxID=1947927 RepID=UPI0035594CF5
MDIILISGCIAIGFIVGFILRYVFAKFDANSVEQRADNIINEAKIKGDAKAKEIIMEARDNAEKERKEAEKEIREKKVEIQNTEKRLNQREDNLDRKMDSLDKKERDLQQKEKNVENKEKNIEQKIAEVEQIKNEQKTILEKLSGLTREEAKERLVKEMVDEAKRDAAILGQRIEQETRENANKKAKEILSIAIQKVAADHTVDTTTSTVQIPNDEIKGRIIGREGRNIKAFEQATGVDLIIDDTPEAITISAFDGVRRFVAKKALEKLIADGRIHPARIEEVVQKMQKEVEEMIKETGEQAAIDSGVPGLHPEIIKLLGRLKFRTSYGQNQLQHTLEVTWLAGAIAGELGLDVTFCKKAGLMHDIGKAVDHEVEGTHHQISAELAKKYGESPKMVNAILAHHEGFAEPQSPEAFVIIAADAISAARPGARRETIENYLKRLEKLEAVAKEFKGVSSAYAIQAGREVRILVEPENIDDTQSQILAHDIAKKIENELEYPGQIKVTVIREVRAQDIAK